MSTCPRKMAYGERALAHDGIPVRNLPPPHPQKVLSHLDVQSLALPSSLAWTCGMMAGWPPPLFHTLRGPQAPGQGTLVTFPACHLSPAPLWGPQVLPPTPRPCRDSCRPAGSLPCPHPPGFCSGLRTNTAARLKWYQQRAGEGLPVTMAPELARCLISSPSFVLAPATTQNTPTESIMATTESPTPVSRTQDQHGSPSVDICCCDSQPSLRL